MSTVLESSNTLKQEKEIINQKLQRFVASILVFFIENRNFDMAMVRQELTNMDKHLEILLEQVDVRQERISLFEENEYSEFISTVLEEVDDIINEGELKNSPKANEPTLDGSSNRTKKSPLAQNRSRNESMDHQNNSLALESPSSLHEVRRNLAAALQSLRNLKEANLNNLEVS